jgi:hypothetical protein
MVNKFNKEMKDYYILFLIKYYIRKGSPEYPNVEHLQKYGGSESI